MRFKYLPGLFFICAAMACNQQKPNYKVVRDEVMKFHDVVMADHGRIVANQMKLDTLVRGLKEWKVRVPELDTAKEKMVIGTLLRDLGKAEDSMNDWMHKFEPDVTGKSNEEAVRYFTAEKAKIVAVDSLYKKEIGLSDQYLSKFKR